MTYDEASYEIAEEYRSSKMPVGLTQEMIVAAIKDWCLWFETGCLHPDNVANVYAKIGSLATRGIQMSGCELKIDHGDRARLDES